MKHIENKFYTNEFQEKYPMYYEAKDTLLQLISNVFHYIPDNEEKIANELLLNVRNFLWVVRLLNIFKKQGYTLIKPNSQGPDIIIEYENQRIAVECVVPENWEAHLYEEDKEEIYFSFHEEEEKILRYTGVIRAKLKQYGKWLEGKKINPENPFFIAISGECQSFSDIYTNYPDIVKTVYPIGKSFYKFPIGNVENYEIKNRTRNEIKKVNLKKEEYFIKTDNFLKNEINCISGLIFNPYGILNNLNREDNNYILVENYNSKNKINFDLIKGSTLYFVNKDRFIDSRKIN